MAIGSPQWMYASGEEFTIDQSLRFERRSGGSPYLKRTTVTPTNSKKATISFWWKNSEADGGGSGSDRVFFGAGEAGYLYYRSDNTIASYGTGSFDFRTTAVYRDPSAWYHIVWAFDTTQGTSTNRVKLYVNNEQVTAWNANTYPSQNADLEFNEVSKTVYVGGGFAGYLEGALAEFNFIDGTQLTPSSFGEAGDYGEWKSKEYSSTYGNNGFYLNFKNDYTVEGFNSVIWRGTAAQQYIGGVGFSPDVIWTKERSDTEGHIWQSSITSGYKRLTVNATSAESDDTNRTVRSIDTDGFVMTQYHDSNTAGSTNIGWFWDMGTYNNGKPHIVGLKGDDVHSTTQKKFGNTALKSVSNSWVYVKPNNTAGEDWDFAGDWTIDFWVRWSEYANDSTGVFAVTDSDVSSNYVHGSEIWFSNTRTGSNATMDIAFDQPNTGVQDFDTGWTPSENTWYHCAFVRYGSGSNNLKFYVDGTVQSTHTLTYMIKPDKWLHIGSAGNRTFQGYIDEFRMSKVARWTSNFTPATSAYTDDANTILLLHFEAANDSIYFEDSHGVDTNTNGTNKSLVRANPTYGQSLVSYLGSGGPDTVGHGLSSAPEMIIVKNRGSAQEWVVYHKDLNSGTDPEDYYTRLDSTTAETNYTFWNDTAPTNTVFSVGDLQPVNGAWGNPYIAQCFHSVTGYSKFDVYTGNGSSTGPSVTLGFKPAFLMTKRIDSTDSWAIVDNVRNPTGVQDKRLTPNGNAAEATNVDVCEFSATGFQIKTNDSQFNANNGRYIYAAFADNREYAYWLDQSGNNNDFTPHDIQESDIMVDSPTNNFCTGNPLSINVSGDPGTWSEGNLKGLLKDNNSLSCGMELPNDGKRYWECVPTINSSNTIIGIKRTHGFYSDGCYTYSYYSTGLIYRNGSGLGTYDTGTTYTTGDVLGFAWDGTARTLKYYKNNTLIYTQTSVNSDYNYVAAAGSEVDDNTCIFNFGQDSSFACTKPAQGNQDSNDIGDFYYEPPTDYLALCTANMTVPDVKPQEHFNAVSYTGNASTNAITGVGFQPDFLWLKKGNGGHHFVFDAVRGADKQLKTTHTGGDTTHSNYLASFDTDGFTIGSDTDTNADDIEHISWNWKANGSGSSNTNGTINTTATSANVDAGFSIVSYRGNATAFATIGHGLSKAPEMIIIKNRDDSEAWLVYHEGTGTTGTTVNSLPEYYMLYLNAVNARMDFSVDTIWGSTATTFMIDQTGNSQITNNSSEDYIAYCWHSVDGYSKVGSYIGNGNANGAFVYTGFRPAYIMLRRSNSTGGWNILDNKREPYNPSDERAEAQAASAFDNHAAYATDFLSNGFKLRGTSGEWNGSGDTLIYIAFAETPFKYSNAR